MKPFMLTSKQGAAVSLYLATSPEVAQVSGAYFVKSKPANSNPLSRDPKVPAVGMTHVIAGGQALDDVSGGYLPKSRLPLAREEDYSAAILGRIAPEWRRDQTSREY